MFGGSSYIAKSLELYRAQANIVSSVYNLKIGRKVMSYDHVHLCLITLLALTLIDFQ